jgi:O-antigen ligase
MLNNIGLPGLLLLLAFLAVIVAAIFRSRGSDTPRGSVLWLLIWAIVFFPVAILYALMRRWSDPETECQQRDQQG